MTGKFGSRKPRKECKVAVAAVLCLFSVEDVVYKKVHMIFIALFAALGVVYYFLTQNISLANMIGGICIGICLYVIALVTSEQIGRGDALLFMSTGIYIGFWNNVVLLILSCLLAAVYGGLYIFVTKSEKDHCLPFIPFVAAAYIILIICGGRVFSIAGI